MPEMTFTVRWPDGREQSCYSLEETGAAYPATSVVRVLAMAPGAAAGGTR